ncbi:hypothetical protein [Leptolyngbya sp. FACHB-261]|uniref:hypothetical protein n=1 Tax=Leptolyngbya sp. FACHB-261 TaxID=2692806 RepID=UPI001689DDAC|nr:hypothetical protein [Leptolyngbya sp. FACHB-261]MBD2100821.1 hypothetical protein [Leptolyngbya sp. FACHB-261]
MPTEIILLIGALIVAFLVFTWLIRVVKVTIGAAIGVALLILVLQLLFGIGPAQLWSYLNQWTGQWLGQLPDQLWRWFSEDR